MFLRKLYIKTRIFLYSIRKFINAVLVFVMSFILFSVVINSFVFSILINTQANNDFLSHKYESAIHWYNVEYSYYKIFHHSEENQQIYFQIPYKKALCYLKLGQKQKSIASMYEGITTIQKQYGVFSEESAYFTRRYLIEFYLDNGKPNLALAEFENLLTIYKKIGYSDSVMADLIRISGDIHYSKKQYETAMEFYQKAYNIISKEKRIDYEVFAKIVERIAEYEIQNKRDDVAISIYQNSLGIIRNSGSKQNEITAQLALKLGNYFEKNEKPKEAIPYYEEAVALISKLPRNNYLRQNIKTYLEALKSLYNQTSQYSKEADINVKITRLRRFSFF